MKRLIIPKDYKSELGLLDTEIAIKFVKDTFERLLADKLNIIVAPDKASLLLGVSTAHKSSQISIPKHILITLSIYLFYFLPYWHHIKQ